MPRRKLDFLTIIFGCDPEFFFRSGERVVGADKILPFSGLEYKTGELNRPDGRGYYGETSKIIIDGVQAELNPRPSHCRALVGNEISCIFVKLVEHMRNFPKVGIDFTQTVQLSDTDMEALSDDAKKFGCMPSKNSYSDGKEGKITINPQQYRYRSAGGHLHLGHNDSARVKAVMADPVRLVKVLDILVGNTCVLLDRDPGNIERRKVYGRAGEFRTPAHGVEYRTLSNFWLRSYQLMGMVMGLARHAVLIVASDYDKELLSLVDMKDIERAINENNEALAMRNFKKIEKFIVEITPEDTEHFFFNETLIAEFKHFLRKGVDYWFKDDPIKHWTELPEGHNTGFETFLVKTVRDDMKNTNSKD